MTKSIVTYSSLVFACLVVVVAFVTATTYTQLAVAAILYPILIFFAYKVLPLRIMVWDSKKAEPEVEEKVQAHEKSDQTESETTGISDINKRAFLKLIGATGLSFFLISVFGRRVESLLLGQNLAQIPPSGRIPSEGVTSAAAASPTDGYKISEIDDNLVGYYGFINKDGGWFIMKGDNNTGSFRYVKGDSDFAGNWKNREKLKYDYFHNVFI
ncbi:hypothetical protein A2858_02675 [Candidatus Daviesbacteria bacterium RIFCSPHIGHO2_01_FULL_36_37]|uniref:Uncharacterized protein n=3 Tax=Candidatus Daviesiibacteriota TaxID=1752718 RepID=A0A0G0EP58_9BACT|nr:MAG: hypothetical protein US19_C0051G0019 [Candidatus Daviesbacteria bacterium GW2011_GWB1_36_5]OGE17613.1 MAG: hypothetical protein A2858_02675 [Candidatus Daviesbacteria bacterium RIFCSPHIGHO2_01_FULL_36_37]OGE31349.1 MAG: hypothetical protein A3C99_03550 [Candidatus Daviesbacteria bacterium RIFCSPHIGHO2_02_FULL_37_9]OGE34230.1 MAG: hypothetical protein A3E66_02700 [Candidatus Daviesbacteria bacterium RIFCSPHIGHO2_12_FULL_37_16]